MKSEERFVVVPHQRAQRTRAIIVHAAAREFDRNGYTATSVNTILEGSGATKGAFYFHFPSKEALAVAIVDAMHARWAPAVKRWAESERDALDVVLGLVDTMTVHCTSDEVVRAGLRLSAEHELLQAQLVAPFPEWERIFRHLFHQAAQTGLLKPGLTPATAAHVLVAGLVGERYATELTTDTELLRARNDELLGVLMPAFACPEWTTRWRTSGWARRSLPALAVPGEDDSEDNDSDDAKVS